jgi:hypothetical protein
VTSKELESQLGRPLKKSEVVVLIGVTSYWKQPDGSWLSYDIKETTSE